MIGYFAYQLSWRLLAPILQFQDTYQIRVPLGGRAVDAEVPGFEVLRQACFGELISFVRVPYFDKLMLELGWVPQQWFARTAEGEPPMPFGVEIVWWKYAVVGVFMLLLCGHGRCARRARGRTAADPGPRPAVPTAVRRSPQRPLRG